MMGSRLLCVLVILAMAWPCHAGAIDASALWSLHQSGDGWDVFVLDEDDRVAALVITDTTDIVDIDPMKIRYLFFKSGGLWLGADMPPWAEFVRGWEDNFDDFVAYPLSDPMDMPTYLVDLDWQSNFGQLDPPWGGGSNFTTALPRNLSWEDQYGNVYYPSGSNNVAGGAPDDWTLGSGGGAGSVPLSGQAIPGPASVLVMTLGLSAVTRGRRRSWLT